MSGKSLHNEDEILANLYHTNGLDGIKEFREPKKATIFLSIAFIIIGYLTFDFAVDSISKGLQIENIVVVVLLAIFLVYLLQLLYVSILAIINPNQFTSAEAAYRLLLQYGEISNGKIIGVDDKQLEFEFQLCTYKYSLSYRRENLCIGENVVVLYYDGYFALL